MVLIFYVCVLPQFYGSIFLFLKGVFNDKYFRFDFDFKISCNWGKIHEQSESQKQFSVVSVRFDISKPMVEGIMSTQLSYYWQ